MSVNENVGIGTVVGTVTQATDPDSASHAFGQQRYYFGSVGNLLSSDGRYRINATTGVITTEVALNFETMSPGGPYNVVAADNQGLAGYTQLTAQVSIAINNVNEQNALAAIPNMSVNENVGVGTVVGTVPAATDPDSSSHIFGQQRYYFGSVGNLLSSDGRYRINATTGVITTEVALNFETMAAGGPYNVIAADNQGQAGYTQSTQQVSIAINNVNEQNALAAIPAMSVNENVSIGTVVGTVTQATDPDSSAHAFGQQRYYFGSVGNLLSSDGRYRINATTGVITTEVALNFETMSPGGPYNVVAADNQGLAGYTQFDRPGVDRDQQRQRAECAGRDSGHVGQRECRRRHRGRHRHPGDRSGQLRPRLRPAALLFRLGRQSLVVGRPLPDQRDDGRDHHRGRAQLRDDGARRSLQCDRRRQSGPRRLHPVQLNRCRSRSTTSTSRMRSARSRPCRSTRMSASAPWSAPSPRRPIRTALPTPSASSVITSAASATFCRRTAATGSTPSPA